MQIDRITIKNFRCFENFEAKFNKELTVIVGSNGSGKSVLLDAVSIAIGAFLTGFDSTNSQDITKDDAFYKRGNAVDLQPQFPITISASGVVDGKEIVWNRGLKSANGKTIDTKDMITVSATLQNKLRNGEKPLLPLLSYYSEWRSWAWNGKKKASKLMLFNRQMGYADCLDKTPNEKMMYQWFEKMTLQNAINGAPAPELLAVNAAIAQCFQNLTGFMDVDVQFNLNTHELDILYRNKSFECEQRPISRLSDGYKNTLCMVADIAYRMALLNPWLLDRVLSETPGIILIDEIDLYLHQKSQQRIINGLMAIFPKMQFIVSTNSPLVINSVKKENLLILKERSSIVNGTKRKTIGNYQNLYGN